MSRAVDEIDVSRQFYHRHYEMLAGNVKQSKGEWVIRPDPKNPGESWVRYYSFAETGFQIPHFIAKNITPGPVRTMLKAVRNRAEQYTNQP